LAGIVRIAVWALLAPLAFAAYNDVIVRRAKTSVLRFKTLFFAEMALSPFVAAIAYLVPVAANWGAFKYVPAFIWLVIFVQCLFTFRWRGLWFLLGPPVAFLGMVAFLVAEPPVLPRNPPVLSLHP
jgi:hypothetical protein